MTSKLTILAIDDEQVILDSIVKLCSAEGWHVESAIDAKFALEKIEKKSYDLIICDIMMPEIDGFQLIEILNERKINTPIIVTTGYSTVENAVRSLNTGAIDFLPKPFTVDELLSCVYRGFQYRKIQLNINEEGNNPDRILFVPCPQTYMRLGYASWAFLDDDGSIRIGLTDLLLRTIPYITGLDLLDIGDEIYQGNSCLHINTDDQLSHSVLAPLSGRIIRRNEKLLEDITLLQKDPYFEGWLYRVVPNNLEFESEKLTSCSQESL